jgi:hypothetical protein
MTPPVVLEPDRIALAEAFLRETVYRSRERQAAVAAIRASAVANPNCGLGERAVVVLDLSERARELLARIHPGPMEEAALVAVQDLMSDWTERQDALDRKRNHFLKEFRGQHGFDRGSYSPDARTGFEAGLARINAEENSERRAAAQRLVAIGDRAGR